MLTIDLYHRKCSSFHGSKETRPVTLGLTAALHSLTLGRNFDGFARVFAWNLGCFEEEKLLEILLPSGAHAFLWLGSTWSVSQWVLNKLLTTLTVCDATGVNLTLRKQFARWGKKEGAVRSSCLACGLFLCWERWASIFFAFVLDSRN